MPSNQKRQPAPKQGQSPVDALAIETLTRIAVRHGPTERRGSAGPTIAKLRENVGAPVPVNRAIYSLVALLRQNGEAEAFAGALVALVAPESAPALSLRQALVLESRAQCAADLPETDLLAGDDSAVELAAFARSSRTHEAALRTARLIAESNLFRKAA